MNYADPIQQAIDHQLEIERKARALDNILAALQTTIATIGDTPIHPSMVVQVILEATKA